MNKEAEQDTVVLDKPSEIRAFAHLQTYHKLKMEVNRPAGPTWRGSMMNLAKQRMAQASPPVICTKRTKKAVLAEYEAFLKERGILT